jgi:hypothetical membrane protein
MRTHLADRAFPNAYLETDEPPRRILRELAFTLVAVLGESYFALTVLLLSLFDSDYNPITQVASDYGVGRYAFEMNLGFFIGGIGLIAFALGLAKQHGRLRSRAGSVLLFLAGSVLVMDSYFTTSIEGTAPTLHATIHGFGGLIFFITAPVGVLLISRRTGRMRFSITLLALLVGFGLLVASSVLSLNAGGLAERIIIEAILWSVVFAAPNLS